MNVGDENASLADKNKAMKTRHNEVLQNVHNMDGICSASDHRWFAGLLRRCVTYV
jgi:hypothetical protein